MEPVGEFGNRDLVHIFVTVDQPNSPIEGAAVHVTIDTPKSTLVGDFTTDASGEVHTHYTVNSGRDEKGLYSINASATKDGASGDCIPCATFTVN